MRWLPGSKLELGQSSWTVRGAVGPTDEDALTLLLDGPLPRFCWVGNHAWADDVSRVLEDISHPCLPEVVDVFETPTEAFILLKGFDKAYKPFSDERWRSTPKEVATLSLMELAEALGEVHQRSGWMQGVRRHNLLMDPDSSKLFIASMPRFHLARKPAIEAAWRDIRLIGELLYEVFCQEPYPGGHEMAALLQEKGALSGHPANHPGVPQVLAGCVSPYGDLAYVDAEDLTEGLHQLHHELVRSLRLEVGQVSTVGNYLFRKNNQDSCGYIELNSICGSRKQTSGFFCVADGIGGIQDGERASGQAVHTACSAFARAWSRYGVDAIEEKPEELARSIVKVVGQQLAVDGELDPHNNRGGTTFTGLLIAGRRASVAHVGDSRAYLVRDEAIHPLSEDHTLANILTKLGELTPEQADKNDVSHRTISRFLSTSSEVEFDRIDTKEAFEVLVNDIYILSSDGAHGEVEDHEILEFALRYDTSQEIAEAVSSLALKRLGRDNVSVVVVRVL